MLEQLKSFLDGRNNEVAEYQLNIDNFKRAIVKIDTEYANNQDMLDFKQQLRGWCILYKNPFKNVYF